ncbi:MAG: DUF2087 domain-containing protein [Oscillospiraceae bacterium]|nr:DUF2087 domain-containing protein [Oscillospiraceae bacterium]
MKNKIQNATIDELIEGFIHTETFIDKTKGYTCLFCHTGFGEDDIYPFKKLLVNGKRAMKLHIYHEHGGVFNNLLALDKNQTGLTDTQKEFLSNYYNGMNYDEEVTDKEIAEKMNISPSTVRFQRYSFREKAKQAKIILALAELLEEMEAKHKVWKEKAGKSAKFVDENEKMLETLFESMSPLVLKTFDFKKKKEEKRLLILKTITQQFEKGKKYTNKEVDAILKEIYQDYVTIRRSLIDYGFMERTSDNREYWVKEEVK